MVRENLFTNKTMHKMKISILCLLLITSCAANQVNGEKQIVKIDSIPTKADIYVDGWIEQTPFEIELQKSRSKIIKFKKSGFEDKEVLVNSKYAYNVFVKNLIWLPFYPVAVAIDLYSEKKWEMPEEIVAKLEKLENK